jgi:hypothetical protein
MLSPSATARLLADFLYVRAIELFLSYFRLGTRILGVYDLRMGGQKPRTPQFGKKNPVSWVGVLPGLDLEGQGPSLFSLVFATGLIQSGTWRGHP